jgi:YfiH family protein
VAHNRELLRRRLHLPRDPHWLHQVHGCEVARADSDPSGCEADAAVGFSPGVVCAVLTADCLPLLFCDRAGTRVAAVHAGWRGLADGVVEAAVTRLEVEPGQLLCWLGPAIGPRAFEVGSEVRERFLDRGGDGPDGAFRPSGQGKWLADLYALARHRLRSAGVARIFGGGFCTYEDSVRFFSHRRDGVTGRMATLVWIQVGP